MKSPHRLKAYQESELLEHRRSEQIDNAQNNLLAFVRYTMPNYITNWHHLVMIRYLNAFANGLIPRLMIFTPPRMGKSQLVSRHLPPYMLGRNPREQIIMTSYNGDLASGMNVDAQRIIDTPEYKHVFPNLITARDGTSYVQVQDQTYGIKRTGSEIECGALENGRLSITGGIKSAGVGGTVTGRGGSVIIIDDPIKNWEEAQSPTVRDTAENFFNSTLYTRRENRPDREALILLTQTRWHDDDLAGRLIRKAREDPNADQWVILSFEALKEEMPDPYIPKCPYDLRQTGEALWPEKNDREDLLRTKATVGSMIFNALYQQRPVATGGALFKREWWKYYKELPAQILRKGQFIDCAQKVGITNDYTAIAIWVETEIGYFLIDVWHGKVEAPQLEQVVRSQYAKHNPDAVVIEDKSSGSSLIQSLRQKTAMPVIAYDPKSRDKEVRAIAATPTIEAGNAYLPQDAPFVEDFILEHERFPASAHDDRVDTTSMMVEFFKDPKYKPRKPRIRSL